MSEPIQRQRFQASLDHQLADRVPLTLGSPSCSLHRAAHRRLLNHLGLVPECEAPVIDNILQIVEPDPQVIRRLDIDVLWLLPHEAGVEWSGDGQSYTDEFGRRFIAGGGFFNQVGQPLGKGTLDELARYTFPRLDASRVEGLRAKAERLHRSGFGLGVDGPWGIYETSSSLRGVADYLADMALNPAYAEAVAERVLEEHHIPFYTLLLEVCAPFAQMVVVSDDLGTQQGLIFSPRMFRRIFKPRLQRLVETIHRLAPGIRVYMHSDGAIADLIPDLIEIGIEGLNPVQYTARGMELVRLKREFGRDLGFFGGTVENELLSYGSPGQIYRVAAENAAILSRNGGFLFASIHNISPEVPAENILALYQAGQECQPAAG